MKMWKNMQVLKKALNSEEKKKEEGEKEEGSRVCQIGLLVFSIFLHDKAQKDFFQNFYTKNALQLFSDRRH